MTILHDKYMQRAIDLALKGKGRVAPNPMVGSVLVYKDQIISEGYHEIFGGPHAEVNCLKDFNISSIEDIDELILYVTLEPCAHHGKTPPCANLIVSTGIKRVVVGSDDPNPKVSGKGFQILRDAGVEVTTQVMKDECDAVNPAFMKMQTKGLPYVILKWAQTKDGFVARKDFTSKWISGDKARKLVHKWRSEEMAIMVATNTAIHDNPSLNVREWEGNDPIRVLIDRTLKVDNDSNILDGSIPTIVLTQKTQEEKVNVKYITLKEDVWNVKGFVEALAKKKIDSVFIEGGSQLLHSFIEDGLWDEARVFESQNSFEEGIGAPSISSNYLVSKEKVGNDSLSIFKNGEV